MDTKLIKSFLKDQAADSIAYFGGNFLIGLFYYISTHEKIEILYPLSIAIFVYILWMVYRFIEYYKLYKGLEKMIRSNDYKGSFGSNLSREINSAMLRLHSEYLDKLNISETNRKKDRRFLSLWIHNMKTPVTVTDLILQRMEQNEITSETGIRSIREENKKLLTGLNNVLDMIRLEDFAKDYIPEQINLLDELNFIINKNKSLFIYNHVFPKVITDLKEAIILSDKKWNELMINQIISNAVKYSREENGESKNIYFYVDKVKNEKAGYEITLTIRDEGIGIPEYDLTKVCEPFFTGDNGRKGYQSSGIGLYFCSEVCKFLGHTLSITSEISKGTSVKITYLAKL